MTDISASGQRFTTRTLNLLNCGGGWEWGARWKYMGARFFLKISEWGGNLTLTLWKFWNFEMGKVVNNLVIDTGAQKSQKLQNDSSTLLTKKYGRVSIYLHSRPGLNLVWFNGFCVLSQCRKTQIRMWLLQKKYSFHL